MIGPAPPAVPQGADSLRVVLDSVFAGPAYQWVERPHPLAFLARWWAALLDWLWQLRADHPGAYQGLLWLLLCAVVIIFVHAAWVIAQTVRRAGAPPEVLPEGPAEVRDAAWFRREAAALAGRGRFPEAMQAEFLALVLDLEGRQALRYHPSKTPAEYAREVRLPEPAVGIFRSLVTSLYGYAFAGLPCGAEEFTAWQARARLEHHAAAH